MIFVQFSRLVVEGMLE